MVEMLQPSQLMPGNQKTYTFLSGPIESMRPPVSSSRWWSSALCAPATLPIWSGSERLISPSNGTSTRAFIGTEIMFSIRLS